MAILVVAVITVLSITAYVEFRQTLRNNTDNSLLSQTEAVIASMASDDSLLETSKEIQAFFGPTDNSKSPVYRVWFEGELENYIASYSQEKWPLDWVVQPQEAPEVGNHKLFDVRRGDIPYRLIWARCPDPRTNSSAKQPLNVIVGTYNGYIAENVGAFLRVLLMLGIIIVSASISLTVGILKWGMKPVDDITTKMKDITIRNLSQPLSHTTATPVELRPFVRAWDQMIERLALAMQQQRRFTADASHELRTPLTIVKSTLQTARSRKRSSDTYESAIDQSLEDLERLEHLIEQLLALTHLDDIQSQSDWQTVDLGNLVTDICKQYLPFAEQQKGTIKWQICQAKVNGSLEQLQRLLINLIDNAIKYGPKAGEVFVSMHSSDRTVNLIVHDQGGRIPPKQQNLIFERFYRIRKTHQMGFTGSGLGLALAQEIVQKHHGSITVQSNPKTGTDFVVVLPSI